MLTRFSRARLPFRRYLQTSSFRTASTSTKYAIALGTVATVAVLGTQSTQADAPSHAFIPPSPTIEHFESYLVKRLEENPNSNISILRSLKESTAQGSTPPEPEPTATVVQKDAEEAETSGGDSGGGAFNPETGEINWDCPCLGGMADGPCGPQFREAFSCFVYSEDEPKGINCVEKFQGMQTCFREHPDVYASEIADDEAADAAEKEVAEKEAQPGINEAAEKEGAIPQPDKDGAESSAPAPESASFPPPAPKPSEGSPKESPPS
ncbi:hypothetical protein B0H19DRAFT_1246707 [Mycena capillaripes]|nr:hypothetical protein B0H19DRAFT_1246707 [Mycena capillaripes]